MQIEFGPYSSRMTGPPPSKVFPQPTLRYNFVPQEDMTPLEASWIAHFFVCLGTTGFFFPQQYNNWRLIERHFEEVE